MVLCKPIGYYFGIYGRDIMKIVQCSIQIGISLQGIHFHVMLSHIQSNIYERDQLIHIASLFYMNVNEVSMALLPGFQLQCDKINI